MKRFWFSLNLLAGVEILNGMEMVNMSSLMKNASKWSLKTPTRQGRKRGKRTNIKTRKRKKAGKTYVNPGNQDIRNPRTPKKQNAQQMHDMKKVQHTRKVQTLRHQAGQDTRKAPAHAKLSSP